LATLVRIASALATSPNHLLGVDANSPDASGLTRLRDRLATAAAALGEADIEIVVIAVEAIVSVRRGKAISTQANQGCTGLHREAVDGLDAGNVSNKEVGCNALGQFR
jgi:hypothetical protein